MAKTETWYLGMRAEQLATVFLTRRSDVVVVKQAGNDFGPDLLVAILENGANTGRYFGVEVKAVIAEHDLRRNGDSVEMPRQRVEFGAYAETPFPVCLFFFVMENDAGYWKWIREPVLDQGPGHRLAFNESTSLSPLTGQDLDTLITRIRQWYEQRG